MFCEWSDTLKPSFAIFLNFRVFGGTPGIGAIVSSEHNVCVYFYYNRRLTIHKILQATKTTGSNHRQYGENQLTT